MAVSKLYVRRLETLLRILMPVVETNCKHGSACCVARYDLREAWRDYSRSVQRVSALPNVPSHRKERWKVGLYEQVNSDVK